MSSQRYLGALADFRRARQQAAMSEILARLTGRSTELLSYDAIYRRLRPSSLAERGLSEIPLDAIVGSVGRYRDFTREFLPRHDSDEERWARVKAANEDPLGPGLPPIQVYQIGEVYFVLDGHHRVSIARQAGATHIPAYVTEMRTRVPLTAGMDPGELALKAEHADLMERTDLDRARPGADLRLTEPGQTEYLEQHIQAHQYLMGEAEGREVPYPEAAANWYDEVYLPLVQAVREQGVLRDFPGRTEADFYLWVSQHRAALEEELGWQIRPQVAASDLAAQLGAREETAVARAGRRLLDAVVPDELIDGPAPGRWRKERVAARYADHLFADILVPVSGEATGWYGLEQALRVARHEAGRLHGLHVVSDEALKESSAARAVKEQFESQCRAAGVEGSLAVEVGEVARKICERAVLADLVVLNVAHPPLAGPLLRLSSGLRTIIRRCPRPVLTVPQVWPLPERALLAYDGSRKAEEALFVATYLADAWQTPLVVVTVLESERSNSALEHARQYLEMHEVAARFVAWTAGPVTWAILQVAEEHACNLLIAGGYGASPVVEAVVGSSVDELLRATRRPVLICR